MTRERKKKIKSPVFLETKTKLTLEGSPYKLHPGMVMMIKHRSPIGRLGPGRLQIAQIEACLVPRDAG